MFTFKGNPLLNIYNGYTLINQVFSLRNVLTFGPTRVEVLQFDSSLCIKFTIFYNYIISQQYYVCFITFSHDYIPSCLFSHKPVSALHFHYGIASGTELNLIKTTVVVIRKLFRCHFIKENAQSLLNNEGFQEKSTRKML